MTERPSPWGRAFDVSSAELADLRQTWADAGRQVWDAATRAGRDIQARTRQELETLGRNYHSQANEERAAAQAASRIASGVVKTVAHVARPGSEDDPGPGRLATEWATGAGPQKRVLGPDSSFSREFVQAPSVRRHLRDYVEDWRRRDDDMSNAYANPPDKRATFGVREFMSDLYAGNGATHFVGSWGVEGDRRGDRVDWRAENDTDATSFMYGRPLRDAGLPSTSSWSRPLPAGRTHQTIQFSTDLKGRPLAPPP